MKIMSILNTKFCEYISMYYTYNMECDCDKNVELHTYIILYIIIHLNNFWFVALLQLQTTADSFR